MRKTREDIASEIRSGAASITMLILSVASFVIFLMVLVGIVRLLFGLAS